VLWQVALLLQFLDHVEDKFATQSQVATYKQLWLFQLAVVFSYQVVTIVQRGTCLEMHQGCEAYIHVLSNDLACTRYKPLTSISY
jgi:hypothetical protein